MSDAERRSVTIHFVRWGARIWAAALFLFWGGFFLEHIVEWFGRGTLAPPVGVMALHSLHGLFLVGLAIGWRWELAGGLLALVAGFAFFLLAAGSNAVVFTTFSIVPAIVWIALAACECRCAAKSETIRSLGRSP